MTDIVTPNQHVPGGVMKQLGDAAGGVVYDQYAPGGPPLQLADAAGLDDPFDQYAPGGPLRQIEDAIEGGGASPGTPDWVPANAVIHIDLVGGDPQGRAWVDGTGEVAVDTLLGNDANTESSFGASAYDPSDLTADGLVTLYTSGSPAALIGAARTKLFAGATLRIEHFCNESVFDPAYYLFSLVGAGGGNMLDFQDNPDDEASARSASTTVNMTIPAIINPNGINAWATTIVRNDRIDIAVNGSSAQTTPITEADWLYGDDELVAAVFQLDVPLRSITLYDPLPDTTGLSALSEIPAPAWVPANAVIHIDLVGGSPQGRAWANGAEVAVDTLLGTDANTVTGWGATEYDPALLTANGYGDGATGSDPAFIGALLSGYLAGSTLVVRFYENDETSGPTILMLSADGNDALQVSVQIAVGQDVVIASWNGSIDVRVLDILNHVEEGGGAINVIAYTFDGTRAEIAANGSAAATGEITDEDRPAANPLVAAMIDMSNVSVQSITLYDPLPDTTGLSALSEVA